MITQYYHDEGRLTACIMGNAASSVPVWVDLVNPTKDEETAVEAMLRIDIPTREEMQEIELSSRLYQEGGAVFLTAIIMARPSADEGVNEPVTFVLAGETLVTIRYHEPRAMTLFAERAQKQVLNLRSGGGVLIVLLEVLIDRLADILEGERRRLDTLSAEIFAKGDAAGKHRGGADLASVLNRIGLAEDLNGKAAESLRSIERLLGFATAPAAAFPAFESGDRARIRTMQRDLRSLNEYAVTQGQKVQFLLDASLGLINIKQAQVVQIFTVIAFVLMPPTLIASIYGMNFEVMPELQWRWGYPAALGGMLVSAVAPYLLFKAKGLLK